MRTQAAWALIAAMALAATPGAAENTTTAANRVETSTTGESIPTASAAKPAQAAPPAAAGVRAFVDPQTGRLTANPTSAQLRQTPLERRATALSRSTAGLRPFALSRGGRGLNLEGRFQSALRVERQADGTFRMTCGHGETDEVGDAHATAMAAPSER